MDEGHSWEYIIDEASDNEMLRFTPHMYKVCSKCGLRTHHMTELKDMMSCEEHIMHKAMK